MEKGIILFIVILLISYKETFWCDFAKLERKQKGTQTRSFLKLTMLLFLFFFVLFFSLPWKLWPQLECKNASFAFLVYVWLYCNKKEQDETFSLRVPGQNWIHAFYEWKGNMYRKTVHTLHSQFTYELKNLDLPSLERTEKETCRRSFTKLTIWFFLVFLYPWKFWPQLDCKYASFAILVYLWPCFKGNMNSPSYRLLTKFAL